MFFMSAACSTIPACEFVIAETPAIFVDNIGVETYSHSIKLYKNVFTCAFVTSRESGERGEKYIGTLDVNIVYPNVSVIF